MKNKIKEIYLDIKNGNPCIILHNTCLRWTLNTPCVYDVYICPFHSKYKETLTSFITSFDPSGELAPTETYDLDYSFCLLFFFLSKNVFVKIREGGRKRDLPLVHTLPLLKNYMFGPG